MNVPVCDVDSSKNRKCFVYSSERIAHTTNNITKSNYAWTTIILARSKQFSDSKTCFPKLFSYVFIFFFKQISIRCLPLKFALNTWQIDGRLSRVIKSYSPTTILLHDYQRIVRRVCALLFATFVILSLANWRNSEFIIAFSTNKNDEKKLSLRQIKSAEMRWKIAFEFHLFYMCNL